MVQPSLSLHPKTPTLLWETAVSRPVTCHQPRRLASQLLNYCEHGLSSPGINRLAEPKAGVFLLIRCNLRAVGGICISKKRQLFPWLGRGLLVQDAACCQRSDTSRAGRGGRPRHLHRCEAIALWCFRLSSHTVRKSLCC